MSIVEKLCSIREYSAPQALGEDEFETRTRAGAPVLIRIVDTLDQLCISASPPNTLLLFICNKQKKFRYSLEELHIEAHLLKDLQVQLIKHKFFVRMEKLAGEELSQMEKHRPHLPLLLKTDPMRKVYGFSTGDIIKIYRRDGSIFFRLVSN